VTERLTLARALEHARAALDGGEAMASVTVLSGGSPGAPAPGERLCVWAHRHEGTLGAPNLDAAALRIARGALAHGTRPLPHEIAEDGVRFAVYVEPHLPPPELVILGAGHVARPLCRLGAMLGFRVLVLDDRPEFATRERFPEADEVRVPDFSDPFRDLRIGGGTYLVLVTRGHKYDFEALRDVLRRPERPAYVGMIGSRRRTRAALESLVREGIDDERLRAVHAPIGLDLRGETPDEIAVSIAAEIVMVRRGGTGQPLRDRERVAERWIRPGG
jgi:xanthine dehydrogenase accessory factor